MKIDDIVAKYGLTIIAILLLVILIGGSYTWGYMNARPSQQNATITYYYVYVTPAPTPTPTPLPPNVLLINGRPVAVIGTDTRAMYVDGVYSSDIPAVTTSGVYVQSGFYNMSTGALDAFTGTYSAQQLMEMYGINATEAEYEVANRGVPGDWTKVGDLNIDFAHMMNPFLNYTNRSPGFVNAQGAYYPPKEFQAEPPSVTPTPMIATTGTDSETVHNATPTPMSTVTATPVPTATPTTTPTTTSSGGVAVSDNQQAWYLQPSFILEAALVIVCCIVATCLWIFIFTYLLKKWRKKQI